MREDYKQMIKILNTYYPLAVIEKATSIRFDKEFRKIYKDIKHAHTALEFSEIIKRVCTLCGDKHIPVTNSATVKLYATKFQAFAQYGNVQLSDTSTADYYANYLYEGLYAPLQCGLRIKYHNGKYYNLRPFTVQSDTFATGMELKK